MEIIKIVSFAFIAMSLFMLFYNDDASGKKAIGHLILMAAGIMIFLFVVGSVNEIIVFIKDIAERANVNMVYIGIILKILGIAYIATFCTGICRDAGASSLANYVDFSAKILILVLAIPILMSVLESILQIL